MIDLRGTRVLLIEGYTRQIMPMMKSLHKLGCHITTYNASRLDMGYSSRYPNNRILSYLSRSNPEKTFQSIREELIKNKYDVVIPLTDFVSILLSQNKNELSNYSRIAVNDWDVFQYASDKQKTMHKCMEYKIPCPYTLVDVENINDILTSSLKYPLVLKPRTGYGSIGFHRVDNEKQLRELFNISVEKHGNMLVQEYIPQTDIQYKAELFVDANGIIKSAVVFNKTRWFPTDGGSTCCSTTVDRPDIVDNCTRLLESIGWRGYADVDLIQDPHSGIAKILEINPRITACVKICFVSGVDFSRQILEYELGHDVTPYMDYKKDVCLRYMHTDILWFLSSSQRFSCKPSWFSFKNTTDQIFSADDILPWFTYSLKAITKVIPEMKKRKRTL